MRQGWGTGTDEEGWGSEVHACVLQGRQELCGACEDEEEAMSKRRPERAKFKRVVREARKRADEGRGLVDEAAERRKVRRYFGGQGGVDPWRES